VQAGSELRASSTRTPPRVLGAVAMLAFVSTVQLLRPALVGRDGTAWYAHLAVSRTRWPLAADIDDRTISGQQIVMVNSADANDAAYLPFIRTAHGHPLPRALRLLSGSPARHDLLRVDDRTLELFVLDDVGLRTSTAGSLTRSADEGLRAGQRFDVRGLRIDVLATRAGQPVHARYTFEVPLEDASLVWLHSTSTGLRRLSLPPVGRTLRLPPPVLPDLKLLTPAADAVWSLPRARSEH
jgi:hypothetical protein